MKIAEETITPSIASSLLDRNESNRPIRRMGIKLLRNLIRAKEWRVTHQGIAVSNDGGLLDGQHRCTAIVEEEATVNMMVARDVDPATFEAIDRGISRSMADVLRLHQRDVSVVRALIGVHQPDLLKGLTPGTFRIYHDIFAPYVTDILNAVARHTRVFSSAHVIAAAVLRLASHDKDEDYIEETYRNLVQKDFSALSPIASSFMRQVIDRAATPDSSSDLFVRAYKVFDYRQQNVTKLQLKDHLVVIGQARALIESIVQEHNARQRKAFRKRAA